MNITKEALLTRKQALIDDYNAIAGALQDIDFWLGFLEREEGAANPAPNPVQE
jgi:hypothetical protein